MSFPTRKEIEQLIADGALCPRCDLEPATIFSLNGVYGVGIGENCKQELKKLPPISNGNSMGGNKVNSVWTHPSGALIPVNEKGNVIHDAQVERQVNERKK